MWFDKSQNAHRGFFAASKRGSYSFVEPTRKQFDTLSWIKGTSCVIATEHRLWNEAPACVEQERAAPTVRDENQVDARRHNAAPSGVETSDAVHDVAMGASDRKRSRGRVPPAL